MYEEVISWCQQNVIIQQLHALEMSLSNTFGRAAVQAATNWLIARDPDTQWLKSNIQSMILLKTHSGMIWNPKNGLGYKYFLYPAMQPTDWAFGNMGNFILN